jgi:hypothetical protein
MFTTAPLVVVAWLLAAIVTTLALLKAINSMD